MKIISIILISSLFGTVFAGEKIELNYPELMVTPRASKRLAIEAKHEIKTKWYKHNTAISASAITTFLGGIIQYSNYDKSKDNNKISPWAGIIVGGGWIALNSYFALSYNAYQTAHNEIKSMPKRTRRDQLVRERLAEEKINQLGKLGNRIKWLSFITNIGAGIYMATKAEKDSTATASSGLTIAAAFGPLLFSNLWNDVAKEQKKYKKRIYRPIVNSTIFRNNQTGRYIPGVQITAIF